MKHFKKKQIIHFVWKKETERKTNPPKRKHQRHLKKITSNFLFENRKEIATKLKNNITSSDSSGSSKEDGEISEGEIKVEDPSNRKREEKKEVAELTKPEEITESSVRSLLDDPRNYGGQ
jgi:hypothetical protein